MHPLFTTALADSRRSDLAREAAERRRGGRAHGARIRVRKPKPPE